MISTKKGKSNSSSQIAVIITLVIAAIFLFVLVFINIAKLSDLKTVTSQVADASALNLASTIGTISHTYVSTLGLTWEASTSQYEHCDTNWLAIAMIIGGILLGFIAPWLAYPLLALTIGFMLSTGGVIYANITSMPVNEAILGKIKGMSLYNSTREAILYSASEGLQRDDVLLKRITGSGGIFFEDVNKNSLADPGEPTYDLTSIETMRNAPVVGRFKPWYFLKRLPLVSDEALRARIEDLLNSLQNHIHLTDWNPIDWVFRRAALVVGPVTITCSPYTSCPSWVYTPAQGLVSVLSITDIQKDSSGNYTPSGFLREKFRSLASNLEAKGYDLSFCSTPWSWICFWCDPTCSGVDDLTEDLNMLVARTKDLVNLPVSLRLQQIDQWLPFFYDLEYDRSHSVADGYSHDIYDRLIRDENQLTAWIAELNTIDASIKSTISAANGHNQYGLGGVASSCFTEYNCCASDCSARCCENSQPCSFQGIYCSACGSPTPPVCVNKDLYGATPSWCPLADRSAACYSSCGSCSRNSQCPNACNFQGQLSNGDQNGPTEVAQAIEILEKLRDDTVTIRNYIQTFAQAANQLLPKEDPTRNSIIYAWKDRAGFNHVVGARVTNYPGKLPYIMEERRWLIFQKCRILKGGSNNNGTGDITIVAWRYDEDTPMPWWTMRMRKTPKTAQFDRDKLAAIVGDIQDNGRLDDANTKEDVKTIFRDYAIISKARAEYGPNKENIRITDTTADAAFIQQVITNWDK